MGSKNRLNALLRTAKILAAVVGLYVVFFILSEAPILSAMHLQMESLHGTATQLDPRRYFDIPAGLPALPQNFIPWPMYEEVSEFLEEDFWKTRNTDCKRALFQTTRHNAGFGSQFNNMLLGFEEALATRRAFVLGPNIMDGGYQCEAGNSGPAFETCFNWTYIGPSSCDMDMLRDLAHNKAATLPQYSVDCEKRANCIETEESRRQPHVRTPDDIETLRATSVSRTKNGTEILHVISFFRTEHGAIGPVIGGKEMDWLALKAYAVRKVWTFTRATQEKIDHRVQTLGIRPLADPQEEEEESRSVPGMKLPRPMCSIHVRKGDKIGSEAAEVPMSKYLDTLNEMNVNCRSYFLASDAISSSREQLQQYLWRHHAPRKERPLIATLDYSEGGPYDADGYRWGSFVSSSESDRVRNTINLLAEYEIMRTSDAFVGAYSSNVARLVITLRAATGWGPETSRSVEGQDWTWLR